MLSQVWDQSLTEVPVTRSRSGSALFSLRSIIIHCKPEQEVSSHHFLFTTTVNKHIPGLNTVWTRFGSALSHVWTCSEPGLDPVWTCSGPAVDQVWTCSGRAPPPPSYLCPLLIPWLLPCDLPCLLVSLSRASRKKTPLSSSSDPMKSRSNSAGTNSRLSRSHPAPVCVYRHARHRHAHRPETGTRAVFSVFSQL